MDTPLSFMDKLRAKWGEGKFVCVGLDVVLDKIPKHIIRPDDPISTIVSFNTGIIEATKDLVCNYKPNFAFYLRYGIPGLEALRETIRFIHEHAPGIAVILDAKVGDIGKTNIGYVEGLFDYFGADAITVHNYLGMEAMRPFLDRSDKGIIVLCKTSNKGAGEFQDIKGYEHTSDVPPGSENHFLTVFQRVASNVDKRWNYNGNCLLVAGATYPTELQIIRAIAPDIPLLIPGIGTQGGDLEKSVQFGLDSHGTGIIINSSSGIIFASSGTDYAEAARAATQKLHDDITRIHAEIYHG